MKLIFQLGAIPILCVSGYAADFHCIRAGADGAGNGSDWANAWTQIPEDLVRGDTYYIAAGNYSTTKFKTPMSGSTYIYFRKATVENHGPAAGWSDRYADGQAVFAGWPVWQLQSSYLDFDGVTGSDGLNCGFKIYNFAENREIGGIQVYNGHTADYINLRRIEIAGNGGGQTASGKLTYGIYCNPNSGTSWLIQHCSIHDVYTWANFGPINNWTMERCWLKNAGSNSGDHHGDGIVFQGSNVTLRWSVLENMLGNSNTTYIEGQAHPDGVDIYGNLFLATEPSEATTQWSGYCTPDTRWWTSNLRFYSNDLIGLHGKDPGVSSANVAGGSSNFVRNNIWQGCAHLPTLQRVDGSSANRMNTGRNVAFKNPNGGDFRLSADTALAYDSTGAPAGNATDKDGVPRSSSIGVYQFTRDSGNASKP